MSLFDRVELAPNDPILGLTEAFVADQRPSKVNLGVGVYLDETGKLPLLKCIRTAGERLAAAAAPHGYLGIVGLPAYNEAVKTLVFGDGSPAVAQSRVATVQTLAGTGALKTGADFLRRALPDAQVMISDPSWENHRLIFERAGFQVSTYRYYDAETKGIDFDGMLDSLRAAPSGSIVVLHACCHNPTGYDLTDDQWDQTVAVLADRGHLPFVDMAYQGFARGVAEDSSIVGKLAASGTEFVVATSFSKTLSLYGQRVGAFHFVGADAAITHRALSQIKTSIRSTYSNPPAYGATLATTVLTDPALAEQWDSELTHMRTRIAALRAELVSQLERLGVDDMGFISQQRGMFSYSGLGKEQMRALRDDHAIYGTDAGRICVAALNDGNLEYVARAIAAVR